MADAHNGWRVMRGAAADGGASGCAGSGTPNETISINRMMLRFRPIAPKPANGTGLDPGSSTIEDRNNILASKKRRKRKYVRACKNNNIKRNRKVPPKSADQGKERDIGGGDAINKLVTLQLLPERSESSESQKRMVRKTWCNSHDRHLAVDDIDKQEKEMWFERKRPLNMSDGFGKQGEMLVMIPQKRESTDVVESWVTVECVTDIYSTCMDGRGCTDVERMRSLEDDKCPGFVSDGSNQVQWINGAYKKTVQMVKKECKYNKSPEVMVWLVIKERLLPLLGCAYAFSCWVRLQNALLKDKCSQMVPCDVWRMDCGGFAWRLDVEAALSLGRG